MPAETKKEIELARIKKIEAIENRRTVILKKLEDMNDRIRELERGP